VESATYDLLTADGPIVVRVVAVAPHRSDVVLGSVLANDALTSAGERPSAMAARTGAVAGINADYFDIGNTNAPTNIVARNGALIRTPRKRYALLMLADGSVRIEESSFLGQVTMADRTVALDALNEFPPPNAGVSLLTPQFGSVPPLENLTLVALAPSGGTLPFGSYTVTAIADNLSRANPGYYLAIGTNAYGKTGVPNVGDTLAVSGDLSPTPLSAIVAAVGGGPLLLNDGAWTDDPDGPNGGEYAARIPSSGAAIERDGTLLLLEVDGRQPDLSVGVTRPEFAALMRAFDATRGMAFDGGGSSALVERVPGTANATVVNSPSDSLERPIADGVFVYSTAPIGPPARIVLDPGEVRALVGAVLPIRAAAVDAAEHLVDSPSAIDVHVDPAELGDVRDGTFTARARGEGWLVARAGALVTRVPIHVTDDPARVAILPTHPFAARNATITLRAHAFDAQGAELALPATLPWRATNGAIDTKGTLATGDSDALVSLLLGDHLADVTVTVGSHDVALDVTQARFLSVPRGGDGAVTRPSDCSTCATLRYSLGPSERAAYAILQTPLPTNSVAVSFEILDDGGGPRVHLALRNAINEDVLLAATTLDHPGWRNVVVHLSPSLAQPARLTGIYVIGSAGTVAAGSVEIKNLIVSVAGSH
jgi:exopolysaccharide biosynthesis protein